MRRRRSTQPREPRPLAAIQIVENPWDPEQLVVRRVHCWDQLVARFFASSLDMQLAAGRSPESTQLLATRAQQLVAVKMRRTLARNFDHLLDLVDRTASARTARVPISRARIKNVEPDLREMLTKLATPLPGSARGVAMARVLLTDGAGPLFDRRSATNLRDAIRAATAELDPASRNSSSITNAINRS